jgi:hypothetical protein
VFIRSNLFSKGHPLKREPGLSYVLEGHKRAIVSKINAISDLDEMTDAFLDRLVKESLIAPLSIEFGKITRKLRTEHIDGSQLPFDHFGERGRSYPKQVARLSIPFSGEEDLLVYAPNSCGMTFPQGEVYGNTIQFDLILWGSADDAQRVKEQIKRNCDLIADYAGKINQQVRSFNESLPAHISAAFRMKLDELTKQHSIFDDLGIPEEPEPPAMPIIMTAPQPKKGKARAVQIIQHIEAMYVQTLNQTNYNAGDVNNAIQGAN